MAAMPIDAEPRTRRAGRKAAWLGALGLALWAGPTALAAEAPYPFEGTWVRAERVCAPGVVRERSYTAREVISPRGRCAIRRVAGGNTVFELLEECRRNDRSMIVTETIRMTSPDSMALKRQVTRLKIPRQVRYTRCSIATQPAPAAPPAPRPAKPVAPDAKPRDP